jgi:hypothetical protein
MTPAKHFYSYSYCYLNDVFGPSGAFSQQLAGTLLHD